MVLIAILKDQDFIKHHWSRKIQNKKSQIIKSTIKQGKNYKIGEFIKMNIALFNLNTSKLQSRYVIAEKKMKQIALYLFQHSNAQIFIVYTCK